MNPLVDIIPAGARKYVYAVAALLGLIVTVWQASDGDWKTALVSLAGTALTTLAHANTTATPPDDPDA